MKTKLLILFIILFSFGFIPLPKLMIVVFVSIGLSGSPEWICLFPYLGGLSFPKVHCLASI